MNTNGDVANWGAALVWGCDATCDANDNVNGCALTCMDADDDCATKEYQFIEYRIDASNQLVRRVLNDTLAQVQQDIFAHNITDLQAALSVDQNMVTLTVTASRNSDMNRPVSTTSSLEVFLRNRG